MSKYQIHSKVWLEFKGQPFLGDGCFRLLAAVDRNGAINAAAKELGISYRKAWPQLQAMEESAPFPLLERRSGGKGGGATLLTCRTQELLKGFMQLSEQVNIAADRSFAEIFPS